MHKTVFLTEAVNSLQIQKSSTILDATFGNGGHSREILKHLGDEGRLIALDRDPEAIERAQALIDDSRFSIYHADFRDLDDVLKTAGVDQLDGVLFDFGISQNQLDGEGRGFSFKRNERLDMRMNPADELDAFWIVNQYSELELVELISTFGEERFAKRIAKKIVETRSNQPIETTKELEEIIWQAVPSRFRYGRIHPATRTFQAIRIRVNNELEGIETGLLAAIQRLKPGGRLVAISFHSLEDRIVKQIFQAAKQDKQLIQITKKPLVVSKEELDENPRARSAKMRVAEKRVSNEKMGDSDS